MDGVVLKRADISDVGSLLFLVEEYHRFESIRLSPDLRRAGIEAILRDPSLGGIWLIKADNQDVGYIALCYGFSIEFAGRDAFIDEFYILPGYRRKGIGAYVLGHIMDNAYKEGIVMIYLEVDEENAAARVLYERHGFALRKNYCLMSVRLNRRS
ncbi:MAG: GNAT family N-acetyltransferase [Hyphomicrobiales bacterium]|nr:GNAT family N-acetyltransferase [Hyphomicrobiales bacterium]